MEGTFTESDFADALAMGDQPQSAFSAMERLSDSVVGVRLFTLMSFDRKQRLASRMYSNMPEAYPVNGTKPIDDSPWIESVLGRGETFVANDSGGLAEVFEDHELIASLGCASVLNVPVVVAGEVLGSINCLAGTGHYTSEKVASAARLRAPGAACFMLARMQGK